jgi:hypothetical protein
LVIKRLGVMFEEDEWNDWQPSLEMLNPEASSYA